ncbi:MAG: FAD-dependent oxidoreductase [Ruminococcaceae bacterium]|nr:FAD-dependent oxidoreductase [Oscillospiraceae bacterium]
MESIWQSGLKRPCFESLKGDTKTDVLIIGGGITGLLCGYMLKESGADYLIVEADKILNGITKNTTAKITIAHGLIYSKIEKSYGIKAAELYYRSQNEALKKYFELSKKHSCDFTKRDNVVYSRDNKEAIQKEIEVLSKIGAKAEFLNELPLAFSVAGAVKTENQAEFNPLKFGFSIAKGLNICENTKVLQIGENAVVTNKGKIHAKRIVVATHFPFLNKHGGYFLKLYQHRSYVLAIKDAPTIDAMYVDENIKGLSFRDYNGLLLLGGGSHRTGKKGGNWTELERFTKQNYKNAKIVSRWATQDCMSLDSIAYIGRYSKNTPNLYVATGFNKWGMTSSMTAAMLLRDLLTGRQNEYEELYSPDRKMLHPQLFANCFESVSGLLRPTAPRCPHMGCALIYNKHEHSWDCSCHGSRFKENGELIDNPATDDKKGLSH